MFSWYCWKRLLDGSFEVPRWLLVITLTPVYLPIFYLAKTFFIYQLHIVDTHFYLEGALSYKFPDEMIPNC